MSCGQTFKGEKMLRLAYFYPLIKGRKNAAVSVFLSADKREKK